MPRIINEPKPDFRDVIFYPTGSNIRSRADVDLNREYIFKNSKKTYNGLPIVAPNMDAVGTFEIAKVLASHGLFTTIHKHYTIDEWENFVSEIGKDPKIMNNIAVSSGMADQDLVKLREICNKIPEVDYIYLDVADGHSEDFVDCVREVREEFDKHTIFAGNVVSAEMVEELILNGADVVKVGPGPMCIARKEVGIRYTQLSAVMECADAAHGLGGHIMSDGGCTDSQDVAKAFAGGADFVTIGGLFASHYHLYRGDENNMIKEILGGVRWICNYIGAKNLKEMPERTTFIYVDQQANVHAV